MQVRHVLGVAAMVGAGWACTPPAVPKPAPQKTALTGSVYNRGFDVPGVVFERIPGPPASIKIRVLNKRDDACAAATDPVDELDPSLVLTVTPAEEGTFAVISPRNVDGGIPTRYATATLFTFTDVPDGGGRDDAGDAGLQPVLRVATGGEIKITALDDGEDGRLNATVGLSFPDNQGFVGPIGGRPCEGMR